jgi:hypothetical protein
MNVRRVPRTVARSTWPVLLFALVVLGTALWAMVRAVDTVTAADVTALAAAVLGVIGTHVGHVTGHELGKEHPIAERLAAGVARLEALKDDGVIDDQEFIAFKSKLLEQAQR